MDTGSIHIESKQKDKRVASIFAAAYSIVLLIFILFPFWSYPFPPPGQQGILVSFGTTEFSGSDENPDSQNETTQIAADQSEEQKENKENQSSQAKSQTEKNKEKPELISKSLIQETGEISASSREQTTSNEKNMDQDEELSKSGSTTKTKEDLENAKKKFGEMIGKGKGNQNESQNAGDPEGDPSAESLEGISKGKANIGGGLAERGVLFEPEIEENSQKAGIVVVRVCVNNLGKVIESKYTQKGSTTTDSDLVAAAIAGSKRYQFARSPIEKQCGTITIDFKLK